MSHYCSKKVAIPNCIIYRLHNSDEFLTIFRGERIKGRYARGIGIDRLGKRLL